MLPRTPDPLERSRPSAGRTDLQRDFFARMGARQPLRELFDHLPGYSFFIKDAHSRIICAGRMILERLGASREDDLIGTTDHAYFPPQIADGYVRDDRRVMETGRPLINHVEPFYNEQHLLDWFVTNKLPVRDASGGIIGVMGTIHSYEGTCQFMPPCAPIQRAVEFIREHHRERVAVAHLARLARLSTRQLQRRFREVFGMSIRDFVAKTRIQAACGTLVGTDLAIAAIALDFGFCDQSAFTQQFRKHTGMTPRKYRQRYARDPGAG